MRAGPLRHRVAIQANTPVPNAIGEHVAGWDTVISVWASVAPVSGKETFRNNKESAEVSHKIRMRYNSTITVAHQILFGSRVFDIQFIKNFEERNIDLEVYAIEQVPG